MRFEVVCMFWWSDTKEMMEKMAHVPSTPPSDAAAFRALADAYATLRDPAKRALYDASIGLGRPSAGGGGFGPPSPGSRPASDSFDAAFDRWWRAQGFASPEPDAAAKDRARKMDAEAAAAAWRHELKAAAEAKARFERSVAAARAARAQRHASVLKKFWVAKPRLIVVDGIALVALVGALAGVAAAWPRRRADDEASGGDEGG